MCRASLRWPGADSGGCAAGKWPIARGCGLGLSACAAAIALPLKPAGSVLGQRSDALQIRRCLSPPGGRVASGARVAAVYADMGF